MRTISDKWIEELPEPLVDIFQKTNADIVGIIAKRLKAIGKLSKSDVIRLSNSIDYLGNDLSKIQKALSEATNKSEAEIHRIFEETAKENDLFAEKFYQYRGLTPLTYDTNAELKAILQTTENYLINKYKSLFNLSGSSLCFKWQNGMPYNIQQAYYSAVNEAITNILSGTVDYNTAIKKTVETVGYGLCEYESGTMRSIDSVARMNILSSVRQMNMSYMKYHSEKYGADGVELSAHYLSAPDHLPAQGHIFTNEQFDLMQVGTDFEDVDGKKYEGFERPIGEWNCQHFPIPIVIGVSEPSYSKETLEEMRQNSIDKYSKTQVMRQMENNLRKMKRKRMALSEAGNEISAKNLQKDINAYSLKYKNYCKLNNLESQIDRARVYGYRAISTK